MRTHRFIAGTFLSLFIALSAQAEQWETYFAYNNVTQIAMAPDEVFAISDGSLFSVNKQSEHITKYDRQSGLNGTNIKCIYYDATGNQLIITYENGKIDLLTANGVRYISDLYDKDMTQRKDIYNVTIQGRTAYFSTHYGVQTMDLRENKLVDSYWLRPGGQETPIQDVRIIGDSIYAFGGSYDKANKKVIVDSLFVGAKSDNLSDYTYWKREKYTGRVTPDATKGKQYIDGDNTWSAGGSVGITRVTATETINYKPEGPLVNMPYRIRIAGNRVGVVQGGYEALFYYRPGIIMILEEGHWTNYSQQYMTSHIGVANSKDYCDIAFDPLDPSHFFIASFGYGLMEFRKDTFYHHYNPSNSALEPIIPASYPYVWVDGLQFDQAGNIWMLNNCTNGVKVLTSDGVWYSFSNAASANLERTQHLLISNQNPNIKIIVSIWDGIGIMDDNGTIADQTDDRSVICKVFSDELGNDVIFPYLRTAFQTSDGALLIGTTNGLYRIPNPEDLLNGNTLCLRVKTDLLNEGREDIFFDEEIHSITEDENLHVWIGTKTSGLYCLSADLTTVLCHYSIENSPLPNNDILSLSIMPATKQLFVGTSEGLCACKLDDPEGPTNTDNPGNDTNSYGSMKRWKTHFSYNNATVIEDAGNMVYALSDGSVLAINKETEETEALSRLTGLHGGGIVNICYNSNTRKTLLLYQNGLIDLIYPDGSIKSMPDILLSTMTTPGRFYNLYSYKDCIYICSSLGIMCANMQRNEISETYILFDDNKEVYPQYVCIIGDSIYAASTTKVYVAPLIANLSDGASWKPITSPAIGTGGSILALGNIDNTLFLQIDSTVYAYDNSQWKALFPSEKWIKLYVHSTGIIGRTNEGIYRLGTDSFEELSISYVPNDIVRSGSYYWMAITEESIIRWTPTETQAFSTNSPFENYCYRIRFIGNKMFVLPGGYFVVNYNRNGNVMIYENGVWTNIIYKDIYLATGGNIYHDFCDVAIDPSNPSHFYVASFGFGLHEFLNNQYVQWLMPWNTPNGLESIIEPPVGYTWVDGLQYDTDGNLWMLNNSHSGVKVLLKNGNWVRISNKATQDLNRTRDFLIWNRNPNIKVLTCARAGAGVGVFDDKGTIENGGDDRAVFYTTFIDQNGKQVQPNNIFSICQMANGEIWVGTESGIIIIPDVSKLLQNDNHCKRVIIPRNDGSGLGDYLLGDEQINAIAEDAAGRKWIATATSGLYLISEDGLETFEHFTVSNSPLVSNEILAVAIHPTSGEVYVGTSLGLLSYQSDANAAQSDLSSIYAYPNPVYRNYTGYISITGLMENTVVNIVDEGGNLICKTRSNGGVAVWDGKDAYGRPATPGVYTALCNSAGAHNVCKILVLHATR